MRAGDGDASAARDAIERALDLGRNQADLLIVVSNSIAMVLDEPERAMQVLDEGLELIAIASGWQHISMARVAYFARDFERALKDARRGPDNLLTRLVEIMSLAQFGRSEDVHDLARAFRTRHPKFDPRKYVESYPITAAGAKRLFLEGAE